MADKREQERNNIFEKNQTASSEREQKLTTAISESSIKTYRTGRANKAQYGRYFR